MRHGKPAGDITNKIKTMTTKRNWNISKAIITNTFPDLGGNTRDIKYLLARYRKLVWDLYVKYTRTTTDTPTEETCH